MVDLSRLTRIDKSRVGVCSTHVVGEHSEGGLRFPSSFIMLNCGASILSVIIAENCTLVSVADSGGRGSSVLSCERLHEPGRGGGRAAAITPAPHAPAPRQPVGYEYEVPARQQWAAFRCHVVPGLGSSSDVAVSKKDW